MDADVGRRSANAEGHLPHLIHECLVAALQPAGRVAICQYEVATGESEQLPDRRLDDHRVAGGAAARARCGTRR